MKKLFFLLTIITIAFWLGSCQDEKDIPVNVTEKTENIPVNLPDNPIHTAELPPATVERITIEPKDPFTPLNMIDEIESYLKRHNIESVSDLVGALEV